MRAVGRRAYMDRSLLALRIASADVCDHSDRLREKSMALRDRLERQLGPKASRPGGRPSHPDVT